MASGFGAAVEAARLRGKLTGTRNWNPLCVHARDGREQVACRLKNECPSHPVGDRKHVDVAGGTEGFVGLAAVGRPDLPLIDEGVRREPASRPLKEGGLWCVRRKPMRVVRIRRRPPVVAPGAQVRFEGRRLHREPELAFERRSMRIVADAAHHREWLGAELLHVVVLLAPSHKRALSAVTRGALLTRRGEPDHLGVLGLLPFLDEGVVASLVTLAAAHPLCDC